MLLVLAFWSLPNISSAMPLGTLLFRTSNNGQAYGYNTDKLLKIENSILKDIYTGHVAIYIGKEKGIDYIVEALPGGIRKVPAKYFINESSGEKLIGAKIPHNLTEVQREKVIKLASNLAESGLAYDFNFTKQKGPKSGEWICVGLTEKIYESANIANPQNISRLEYNVNNYAINITPDGFDNISIYNQKGDCFSKIKEYSKIDRETKTALPAPEVFGFNAGLEQNGERYFFFPQTQFFQPGLDDVKVDIQLSNNFNSEEIRGKTPILSLLSRWTFINNPISAIKQLGQKIGVGSKKIITKAKEKLLAITTRIKEMFNNNDNVIVMSQDNNINPGLLEDDNSSSTKSISQTANKKSTVKKTTTKKATTKKTLVKNTTTKKNIDKKTTIPSTTTKATIPKTTLNNNLSSLSLAQPLGVTSAVKVSSPVHSPILVSSSKTTINPTSNNNLASNNQVPSTIINQNSNSLRANSVNNSNISNDSINTNQQNSVIDQAVNPAEKAMLKILISAIFTTGTDDIIELYNPNNEAIDLASGYRLEKAKTASDPSIMIRLGNIDDGDYPGGTVIAAKSYYSITSINASSEIKNQAQAIAKRDDFSFNSADYTVYLGKDAISSDTDMDILDKLGYGPEAKYFEGLAPAPEITDYYFLRRKVKINSTVSSMSFGGSDYNKSECYDSDDNSKDFLLISTLTNTNEVVDNTATAENYLQNNQNSTTEQNTVANNTAQNEVNTNSNSIVVNNDSGSVATNIVTNSDINSNNSITNTDVTASSNTNNNSGTNTEFVSNSNNSDLIDETSQSLTQYYGLESPDLAYIWHFDECGGDILDNALSTKAQLIKGSNTWEVGKWGCALKQYYKYSALKTNLPTALNDGTFSVSLSYKFLADNSRFYLSLNNNSDQPIIKISFFPYYTDFVGALGSYRENGFTLPYDNKWHQLILAVSNEGRYFALYNDGRELLKKNLDKPVSNIDSFEIKGDNNYNLIDEIGLWQSAITKEMASVLYKSNLPLYPALVPSESESASLLHYWDFSDQNSDLAQDRVGSNNINFVLGSEKVYGKNDLALRINKGNEVLRTSFLQPITNSSISLDFWWRNSAYPEEGRGKINLETTSGQNLGLVLSMFHPIVVIDGQEINLSTAFLPKDDRWHHVVIVYNSTQHQFYLYIDGSEKIKQDVVWSNPGIISLNISNENFFYDLDEIGVWRGALTKEEIIDLFQY